MGRGQNRAQEELFATDEKRAEFLYQVVHGVRHMFTSTPRAIGLRFLSCYQVIPRSGQTPALVTETKVEVVTEYLQRWRAPEMLSGRSTTVTQESLTYAVGMILWELLTGTVPFGHLEGPAVVKVAMDAKNWLPQSPDTPLWSVLRGCVQTDPADRLSLDDVSGRLMLIAQGSVAEQLEKSDVPATDLLIDRAPRGVSPGGDAAGKADGIPPAEKDAPDQLTPAAATETTDTVHPPSKKQGESSNQKPQVTRSAQSSLQHSADNAQTPQAKTKSHKGKSKQPTDDATKPLRHGDVVAVRSSS
jgi:hypothetical protein